ncbi:MAG: squalene/phytoene synthase family protein [Proteobacteria bacterium]|nr:squalene/phytoene synthase family protein [Pseudomonadota bacterium]
MKLTTPHSVAHQLLQNKGKSFYWASHFLGKKYRHRAMRLYGFCRYLDDMVDEEGQVDSGKQNIMEARQALLQGSTDQASLSSGIELIQQCHIPQEVVFDLIAGIESDTELVRIVNEPDLLHYCYQVAGTVGLMMCYALDVQDQNAKPYAIDLGIAMQLTNICRDIKADALVNRQYIPNSLIGNIEVAHLIAPNEEQATVLRLAVASLLKLADHYYQSGEKGLFYLPLRARISILIAARIYHDIGNQLASEDYAYWDRRMVVSTPRKIVITCLTIVTACFNPHFWFRPKNHDVALQKPLHPHTYVGLSKMNHIVTDVIVIGAGCAGLSLGFNLAEMGEDAPKTIFLEQRTEYHNDRTWCFWGHPKTPFMELVQNRWSKVQVKDSQQRSALIECEASPYQLLIASDFYQHTLETIEKNNKLQLRKGIKLTNEPFQLDNGWLVQTDAGSFISKIIIDTRPLPMDTMGDITLWQSFVGYEIECNNPLFDPNTAHLMDFCEANNDFVGFTYVLPFSTTKALIEFTSFGSQAYSKDDLLERLNKTVSEYVGESPFSIIRTESGLIPMGLGARHPKHSSAIPKSYAQVGVTAGSARPATGYTFQRIQTWAQECAKELRRTGLPVAQPTDPFLISKMDNIFLNVLRNNPAMGSSLFMDMFSKVSHPRLIRFLSDHGGILDYLAVVTALPPLPFLKEVFRFPKR